MRGILLFFLFCTSAFACDAQGILTENFSSKVLIHNLARDFLTSEMLRGLDDFKIDTRGYEGPRKGYSSNPNLVFIRDYSPVLVKRGERTLALTYKAPLLKYEMASGPALENHEVRSVPLKLEGGNVIATEDALILSDKVLKENNDRSREEIVDLLAKATDTNPSRVLILEWMPGERTGHVDEYIGVLDSRTVAVPYIPESAIELLGYRHERDFSNSLNHWLNARSGELAGLGLEIVRLPMLPPKNLRLSKISPLGWDAQIPTPVNWASSGNKLFIPVFNEYLNAMPENVRSFFIQDTARILERYGYAPQFIEAGGLLYTNGLFHCITAEY